MQAFCNSIKAEGSDTEINIDIPDIVLGFTRFNKALPNPDALHGLAIWEIYRAHAEASLDGKIVTGQTLFSRWKAAVMQRIIHDFHVARRARNIQGFTDRWHRIKCQWFTFDPGIDGAQATIAFGTPATTTDPCPE